MHKQITFSGLERALLKTGFVLTRSNGGHKIFRHRATDAMVVLPALPDDRDVDAAHLVAVSRTLDEKGVIERDAFRELLEAV